MKILTIFSLLFINIFVESKEIDNKLLKCLGKLKHKC